MTDVERQRALSEGDLMKADMISGYRRALHRYLFLNGVRLQDLEPPVDEPTIIERDEDDV